MKEPKEMKQARQRAVTMAIKGALCNYFMGEGAAKRTRSFLVGGTLKSCASMMAYVILVSWAIVGGLTLGPDHAVFLAQVHAWAQSTPFDVVSSTIQRHANIVLIDGATIGLLAGFAWQLMLILKPARHTTQAAFYTE